MPPEPLPWDRKDFFRERKHGNGYDRVSEPLGGPVTRWRDSPSHGSRNDFGRWGFPSDFRRPPGHAKQGGWHQYPGDLSHGYATSRSGDRFFHDGGDFRPSGPYRDGRYGRNFREHRASYNQKDWRGHSWDYNHHHGTLPSGPAGLYDAKDQKSVDDVPARLSHLHSDVANTSNQLDLTEHPHESCGINESAIGGRVQKENSLAPIDWKRLKWSRSGSLTSRGSGFSLSSSSKSAGESCDVKMELPPKIATPDETSSADAVGCIASPTSLEDTTSRKKPRLGWGEGLAKYEKKKVEGPDESQTKSASVLCTSSIQPMHSPAWNLADKSPRTESLFECTSPMTPSSVAYSSSPGLDDKSYVKAAEIDSDANNLSPSSAPRSLIHFEGLSLNLENMELTSLFDFNGLLNELLQNEEQSLIDSGLIKTSAVNKLLLLKGDILKALELTESKIDSLDNELKSLKSQPGSNSPCQESSSSMSIDCKAKSCSELNMIQRPSLAVVTSGNMIVEDMAPCGNHIEEAHAEVKDEYIDSPGTATSNFMEPKSPFPDQQKHDHPGDMTVLESAKFEACTSAQVLNAAGSSASDNESKVERDGNASCYDNFAVCENLEDNALNYILAANKEAAVKASKIFSKLFPCSSCDIECVEAINSRCNQNNLLIKERLMKRKKASRFKERVLSLKYKVFQYLWKDDLRLSERKYRAKSQKKVESGYRSSNGGFQKYRSSIRSQFASPACNLSLFPTSEVVSFTSKLLSDPQIRCYRNDLKMPALILDKKEKMLSRFLSNNGLVQDPCAVERERAVINPWTAEEEDIFLDKYATFGKDFRKISSCLYHKTTADCIEFYYKNHKSDRFKKTKQQEHKKQEKVAPTTRYLMTSGKKWSREMNAVSLDMLGAASAILAHDYENMKSAKTFTSCGDRKLRGDDGIREISSSYDIEDERETEAADVLAGICGSLSSEAMSSCVTSSADPGEGTQDWKSSKPGSEPSGSRCPLTAEVMQNVDDDTCSDESCGYNMNPVDWTDEEKSGFVQAFTCYGKDFVMISRCVRTKSRDQCKVFFSKARKCLGLEMLYLDPDNGEIPAADDPGGGRSDTEDTCVVENDLATCGNRSSDRTDENMPMPASTTNHAHDDNAMNMDLSDECIPVRLDETDLTGTSHNSLHRDCQSEDTPEVSPDNGSVPVLNEEVENTMRLQQYVANADASFASDCGEEPGSAHGTPMTKVVTDGAETGFPLSDEQQKVVAEIASIEKPDSDPKSGGQDNEDKSLAPLSCECLRDQQVKRSASANDLHRCLRDQPSPDLGDSCSMDKGSLNFSMQVDTSAFAGHLQPSASPCVSRIETSGRPLQVYPKKSQRSSSSVHSVDELPLLSKNESQMIESGSPHQQCSPDASEKPCRNGDVKLFGQILSKSSMDRHAFDIQGSISSSSGGEERSIRYPSSCSSLDMFLVNDEMDKYVLNNGTLGPGNFPVKSSGLWDGNRIHTGYSSLPDSALLLAKYPAAFASPSMLEQQQQPVQSIMNANKSSLASVASSNGGLIECQKDTLQPYILETKQQDMFFRGTEKWV